MAVFSTLEFYTISRRVLAHPMSPLCLLQNALHFLLTSAVINYRPALSPGINRDAGRAGVGDSPANRLRSQNSSHCHSHNITEIKGSQRSRTSGLGLEDEVQWGGMTRKTQRPATAGSGEGGRKSNTLGAPPTLAHTDPGSPRQNAARHVSSQARSVQASTRATRPTSGRARFRQRGTPPCVLRLDLRRPAPGDFVPLDLSSQTSCRVLRTPRATMSPVSLAQKRSVRRKGPSSALRLSGEPERSSL